MRILLPWHSNKSWIWNLPRNKISQEQPIILPRCWSCRRSKTLLAIATQVPHTMLRSLTVPNQIVLMSLWKTQGLVIWDLAAISPKAYLWERLLHLKFVKTLHVASTHWIGDDLTSKTTSKSTRWLRRYSDFQLTNQSRKGTQTATTAKIGMGAPFRNQAALLQERMNRTKIWNSQHLLDSSAQHPNRLWKLSRKQSERNKFSCRNFLFFSSLNSNIWAGIMAGKHCCLKRPKSKSPTLRTVYQYPSSIL